MIVAMIVAMIVENIVINLWTYLSMNESASKPSFSPQKSCHTHGGCFRVMPIINVLFSDIIMVHNDCDAEIRSSDKVKAFTLFLR